MKKICKVFASVLCVSLLASCNEVTGPSNKAESEAQETSETQYDVIFKNLENVTPDFDSQLEIITAKYDSLLGEYNNDSVLSDAYFAITDLNHNGRLEILISWCQGSGAFSSTLVYEITEDHKDIARLKPDPESKNDDSADFIMYGDGESHVEVYDCYRKGNEYFYLLQDYVSAGWSDKLISFHSYSFKNAFKSELIGSCSVSANEKEKTVSVWLSDPESKCFNDEKAFEDYLKSYWKDYEEQKSCEVAWFPYSQKTEFPQNVKASYQAFNPKSEKKSEISYDFHKYFDCFYADEYKYVIAELHKSDQE